MATYEWTSGRMLHLKDCVHFYDDQPPRLATDEELRALPVCSTCAGTSASTATAGPPTFVCSSCHLTKPLSTRTEGDICRDCA